MRKGFSATTFVLVAVLVGALFMVGKTVIPPPPGPPEPPPKAQASTGNPMVAKSDAMDPKMRAEKMKQMMEQQKKAHLEMGKLKAHKPKFDPTQIEISPRWTDQRKQGDVGNEEMAKKVAVAKEQMAEERKEKALHAVTPAKVSP